MADSPTTETFQPITSPSPDWSAAANWSDGIVPGAGMTAVIAGTTAAIDPGVTIEAAVDLDGGCATAALIGNGGAIALGATSSLAVDGTADLFACDSVVGTGLIALADQATLDVVVDLGALSGLPGAPPPSFANEGTISLGAHALLDIGGTEFENAGLINVEGGTLAIIGGAAAGGGTIDLGCGALARFGDELSSQTVSFGAGGGTLVLDDPYLGPGVTIDGMAPGDAITLPTLPDARLATIGNEILILDRAGNAEASFILGNDVSLAVIDGTAGSAIVAATPDRTVLSDPPCFARDTMILTPTGYRPVEQLAVGDPVITATGKLQDVIWAGSRTLDLAAHRAPEKVRPIRLAPGALGPGVPHRALRLSPDHALFLDGALVPAKLLVNDATIVQETGCLAVTYHHIELTGHDILLAEGAPCESYLDTGNRAGFARATSWPVRPRRHDEDACAPLCTGGDGLRRIRERLHRRAFELGFELRAATTLSLCIGDTTLTTQPRTWLTLPARHDGRAVIRSDRFVPASVDPASDDRRELGVALAGLRTSRRLIHAEQLALDGFHPRAGKDISLWTTGAGTIRLPPGTRRIRLEISGLPVHWHAAPLRNDVYGTVESDTERPAAAFLRS